MSRRRRGRKPGLTRTPERRTPKDEARSIEALESRGFYLLPPDLIASGAVTWLLGEGCEVLMVQMNTGSVRPIVARDASASITRAERLYAPLPFVALARAWKLSGSRETGGGALLDALRLFKADERFAEELRTVVDLARPERAPRDLWEPADIEHVRRFIDARLDRGAS